MIITKTGKIIVIVIAIQIFISITVAVGVEANNSIKINDKIPLLIGYKNKPEKVDKDLILGKGGEIKHSYNLINAIAAKLPPQEIEALKKNANIAYIENDSEVHTFGETLPWGVDRIDAELVYQYNKGNGIKVAVIDTGIEHTHPDLNGNYKGGYDFLNNDADPMDDNGHGTHVAGIIAAENNNFGVVGVAPEAYLYGVKVLGSGGTGVTSDAIAGIEWSISNGMQVITMSFGSSSYSKAFQDIIDQAYNQGIVLVAAAGNNAGAISYPAKYSSVIAVTATDINDNIASFSNFGPEAELAAPGVNIYSTYKGSTYATLSGTSMSTPHVTGTVALLLKTPITREYDTNNNGRWDPPEVRKKLHDTAWDMGAKGWDQYYGHGLVNANKAAPATGFLNGTIRDSNTNLPISGAIIVTNTSENTTTNVNGSYSLILTKGTYLLNVTRDPEYNYNNTVSAVVTVGSEVITDIKLTPKLVWNLSGTVVNESGFPVSNALVKLVAYPNYNTTTNHLGNYSMSIPSGIYQTSANASGYFTNVTTVAVNADKRQDLVLTISPPIFIPWIAYSQSDWYTPVQIQNVNIFPADVNLSMYDQNGNLVTRQTATIQPNTALAFWPPAGPTAGGSAVITSTQNVVAIVNEIPKNGLDGMSYSGFTQGSTKVYIPWIAYSQSDWYTPIQVQNIDSVSAGVSVSMYDQNGNLVATQTGTIQPNTASVFWPPAGPTAGGSAVITSTRNVIAIVNEMGKITSQGMSYEGFIAGSKKVYIPAINFSQTNTYTPIQVQNIGTASATVNVKIYDSNGLLVQTQSGLIPPNTASVLWPPAASTAYGSAVIESTQDVIAIVNAMINNNNWAMSYDGFAAGSSQVFIPWIAYGNSGWNTPVYVQNTGTVNANVAVSFYDQNGAPVEIRNAVIPANTSQIFVPASTAPTTGGSAVVTSSQPVVAGVSEINVASTVAMGYGGSIG